MITTIIRITSTKLNLLFLFALRRVHQLSTTDSHDAVSNAVLQQTQGLNTKSNAAMYKLLLSNIVQ